MAGFEILRSYSKETVVSGNVTYIFKNSLILFCQLPCDTVSLGPGAGLAGRLLWLLT